MHGKVAIQAVAAHPLPERIAKHTTGPRRKPTTVYQTASRIEYPDSKVCSKGCEFSPREMKMKRTRFVNRQCRRVQVVKENCVFSQKRDRLLRSWSILGLRCTNRDLLVKGQGEP